MQTSRRHFLRDLAVTAVAAAATNVLPSSLAAGALNGAKPAPQQLALDHAGFAAVQGEVFRVRTGDGRTQEMVLGEVTRYDRDSRLENFSVRFIEPAASALPGGTHRFSHPRMGEFELFVVSTPVAGSGHEHVAVFNRLV